MLATNVQSWKRYWFRMSKADAQPRAYLSIAAVASGPIQNQKSLFPAGTGLESLWRIVPCGNCERAEGAQNFSNTFLQKGELTANGR